MNITIRDEQAEDIKYIENLTKTGFLYVEYSAYSE